MKNLNLFKAAALLVLFALLMFNSNNLKAKTITSNTPVKVKYIKTKHSKRQYSYYALFNFGGNEYELFGHGGGASGSFSTVYKACINGVAYSSGTASGTFTISGGGMSVSNVYITVTGFPQQGPYSGGATYSTSAITLNCGGGGAQ